MFSKRKENKKQKKICSKRSQLIIVGSLLIFVGVMLVGGKYFYSYLSKHEEKNKLDKFYEIQEEINIDNGINLENNEFQQIKEESIVEVTNDDYIAVIKIPKINLERGLYSKDSSYNNVDKNIQILKESDYPNIDNGNFILASHSGNAKISFFRNLYKLSLDDEIYIFFNGQEYRYKVVNIYDIEKTGTANIVRNKNKTTLTLVTCRQNTNKQIIVICELVNKN